MTACFQRFSLSSTWSFLLISDPQSGTERFRTSTSCPFTRSVCDQCLGGLEPGARLTTRLLSRFQVKDLVATDDFKPNSAMVVLDFLIRHSFIEPDTGWCGVFCRCVQVSPSADVLTLCFSF